MGRTVPGTFRRGEYIWKGIYGSFQDVPAHGEGHAEFSHIQHTQTHTRSVADSLSSRDTKNPPEVPAEYDHFPLLAALEGLRSTQLSVLDIGGGLGISYLYLRSCVPRLEKIRYHIVEAADLCKAGESIFADNEEITFLRQLPGEEAVGAFALVQMCSSLQYMEHFRSVVTEICSYRARFIYLLKIPVGSFPTFATAQYNHPDSVVPCWFFNYQELVQLFAECGYGLIYHGTHDRVYDTTNFDPAYRMSRYSHLLFARH